MKYIYILINKYIMEKNKSLFIILHKFIDKDIKNNISDYDNNTYIIFLRLNFRFILKFVFFLCIS